MESISPARLAASLLDDCLAGRTPGPERLTQLAQLALDSDEAVALIASRQLFGTLVEALADRFEPALCDLYARLFAQVIEVVRPEFPAADLVARYAAVRAARPPAFEPDEVVVLSRVTLGADIAVTSILMDGARRRFPRAKLTFAGPRQAWELFAGSSWSFVEIPYGRTGLLHDRLSAFDPLQAALARPATLLLDPDSRLTQLGLLPVCPPESHHLFESRGFGGDSKASLPELAARWVQATLGIDDAEPWFHPKHSHALPGVRSVAVSFGIGENPAKRAPEPFETSIVEYLVDEGWQVILDTGAPESEESRRARQLVANLGPAGRKIALHEGSFASFSALIANANLYLGYDSAGQHVAAALGVPLVSLFGGYSCERMFERWSPHGPGPIQVITLHGRGAAELTQLARTAIRELLPQG